MDMTTAGVAPSVSPWNAGHLWTLVGLCGLMTSSSCARHLNEPARSEFLSALLIDYNHTMPPMFEKGEVCDVFVSVFVNSFNSLKETDMEFTADLTIEQQWMDERLAFHGLVSSPFLELDSRLMDRLWVPDLYFVNEKRSSFKDVTVPNRMLHVYHNGSIVYKVRLAVTASCPMNLQNYPMDRQLCSLFIQSFGFSTKSLLFHWGREPLRSNTNIQLPHFTILTTGVSLCNGLDEDGNFTCIEVDFYLQRHLGYYLLQLYVPSCLVVMMSWLSFWISPGSVSGRTSLGILTVLTITKQSLTATASLPKVSYIKAIDIWMAFCFFFVFAAFLQYAVLCVSARARRPKGVVVTSCMAGDRSCERFRIQATITQQQQLQRESPHCVGRLRLPCAGLGDEGEDISGCTVKAIDKVSRVAFPVVFFAFATLYSVYFAFYAEQTF